MKSIKGIFSSDDTQAGAATQAVETTSDPGTTSQAGNVTSDVTKNGTSKSGRKFFTKRSQDTLPPGSLPPGTGPGTSGRPATESDYAKQSDERSRGFGSDAAAATGVSQAGTHQGTGDSRVRAMNGDPTTSGGQSTYLKAGEFGPHTEGKC